MTCKICGEQTRRIFAARILRKYDVEYLQCTKCGFLQTESPYWLEEAYRRPINISDTGLVQRNIDLVGKSSTIIAYLFDNRGLFLDFAGGYGIYTRLMRDRGFNCYWHDKYSENIFAVGFEARPDMGQFELLTAFEVFEHFADPVSEIKRMLSYSSSILFSTLLLPDLPPGPEQWWYYGREHGQHISFFTKASLTYLGNRFGLNLYSDGNALHLFSKKSFPPFFFPSLLKLSKFQISKLKLSGLRSLTIPDSEKLRQAESL